jgi:hypothetical protein
MKTNGSAGKVKTDKAITTIQMANTEYKIHGHIHKESQKSI